MCKASLLSVLFVGAWVSAAPANAATIFFDDFNAGASALWGNDSGDWTAAGGVYFAQAPSTFPNAHSFVTPFVLTDFSVSVDVNSGQDGGVWLRSSNTGDGIGVEGILFVFAHSTLYWHDVSGGAYGAALGQVGNPEAGGSFSLRIDVLGNLFQAFLNGSPATSITSNSFGSGLTGVYSFASQSFDNFRIEAEVPVPAALPLLGSALAGFAAFARLRRLRKV